MTLQEIIKQKAKRLQDIPDEFLSQIEKTQKRVYNLLLELLSNLETTNGKIDLSVKNLQTVDEIIASLSKVIYGSEYEQAVKEFAKEFDTQAQINEDYFNKAFSSFSGSGIAEAVVKKVKQETVESLIGGSLDENFLKPAKKLLTDLVSSGSTFDQAVTAIQDFAIGNEEVDGKLLKYSKQIAHDQFAYSDRGYTNAAAEEVDAEWYFYSGGEIPTTRCFCEARNGQYFYYKQIEAWGRGEDLGECRSGDLWQGANPNTNEQTIFIYAGGFNCLHSILPVSIFDVPAEIVQNAISKYGYEPSQFEADQLGL